MKFMPDDCKFIIIDKNFNEIVKKEKKSFDVQAFKDAISESLKNALDERMKVGGFFRTISGTITGIFSSD